MNESFNPSLALLPAEHPWWACTGWERIEASNTGSPCLVHFTRSVLTRGTPLFSFTSASLILTKASSAPGCLQAAGSSSHPRREPLGLASSALPLPLVITVTLWLVSCSHHFPASWSSPFILQFSASSFPPFFPFPPSPHESILWPHMLTPSTSSRPPPPTLHSPPPPPQWLRFQTASRRASVFFLTFSDEFVQGGGAHPFPPTLGCKRRRVQAACLGVKH